MSETGKSVYLPGRRKVWPVLLFSFWLACGGGQGLALAAGPEARPALPSVSRPPVVASQATVNRPSLPARKPAKIKLHHNAKGEYTWDISGDNVEEILRIDRRLRKAIDSQE